MIIIVIGKLGGCWLIVYINFIIVLVVLLYRIIYIYRFKVSMICVFFVRKIIGFSEFSFDILLVLVFLVIVVECWVLIFVIGCCSIESFLKLYFVILLLL